MIKNLNPSNQSNIYSKMTVYKLRQAIKFILKGWQEVDMRQEMKKFSQRRFHKRLKQLLKNEVQEIQKINQLVLNINRERPLKKIIKKACQQNLIILNFYNNHIIKANFFNQLDLILQILMTKKYRLLKSKIHNLNLQYFKEPTIE